MFSCQRILKVCLIWFVLISFNLHAATKKKASADGCQNLMMSTKSTWQKFFQPKLSKAKLKSQMGKESRFSMSVGSGGEGEVVAHIEKINRKLNFWVEKHYRDEDNAKESFRQLGLLSKIAKLGILEPFTVIQVVSCDQKTMKMEFLEGRDVSFILHSETLDMQGQDRVQIEFDSAMRRLSTKLNEIGLKTTIEESAGLIEGILVSGIWEGHSVEIAIWDNNVLVNADTGRMTIIDIDPE